MVNTQTSDTPETVPIPRPNPTPVQLEISQMKHALARAALREAEAWDRQIGLIMETGDKSDAGQPRREAQQTRTPTNTAGHLAGHKIRG